MPARLIDLSALYIHAGEIDRSIDDCRYNRQGGGGEHAKHMAVLLSPTGACSYRFTLFMYRFVLFLYRFTLFLC